MQKIWKNPAKKGGVIFYLIITILCGCSTQMAHSQQLSIDWQRGYNFMHNWSGAESISATTDGGYIVAGYANTVPLWGADLWVAKLDGSGNPIWERHFGGSSIDIAKEVLQTADGGYIVIGEVSSIDGDATDNHGSSDIWIIKLDASGNLLWKKACGGTSAERVGGIVENPDGTLTIAGTCNSNNGDLAGVVQPATNIPGWPFSNNVWLFKLDNFGNIVWQKTYGGSEDDVAEDIKLLSNGDYIIAGSTNSNDGDVAGLHTGGLPDVWVFRTNSAGTLLWQKCLGGTHLDYGHAIIETTDLELALVGTTHSSDGDVSGQHPGGWSDIWVIKLSTSGNLIWQKTIGGSFTEIGCNLIEYQQKLIVGGTASSTDGDINTRFSSSHDVWLTVFSLTGSLLWEQCYGGSNRSGALSPNLDVNTMGMVMTDDGGLAIASKSTAPEIPFITNNVWSAYVVKFNPEFCDTTFLTEEIQLCINQNWPFTLSVPNAPGTYLWNNGTTNSSMAINDTGTYWCVYGRPCSKNTDTFSVTYKPELGQPNLHDSIILCNNTVSVIGVPPIANVDYLWNTGDTLCCIVPKEAGMYTLTVNDGCFTFTDSIRAVLYDCNTCLFMPNAFTPNNDGENDVFKAKLYCAVTDFQLAVYNRWGERIFASNNVDVPWDGYMHGQPLPTGTYFYYLSYREAKSEEMVLRGDVTLIR